MCADIQRTLKIRDDLETTKYTVLGRFFKHVVWVRVDGRRNFKKNVVKFQNKHPDIMIDWEPVSSKKRIIAGLGLAFGIPISVVKLLVDLWLF